MPGDKDPADANEDAQTAGGGVGGTVGGLGGSVGGSAGGGVGNGAGSGAVEDGGACAQNLHGLRGVGDSGQFRTNRKSAHSCPATAARGTAKSPGGIFIILASTGPVPPGVRVHILEAVCPA